MAVPRLTMPLAGFRRFENCILEHLRLTIGVGQALDGMNQMVRQLSAGIIFLSLGSYSFAGVAITLVPSDPHYYPGIPVNIDVLAQLTPDTPSVPGPGGTASSIRVRMMQFDLADSDAALTISPVNHHLGADFGPVPFWDFSGAGACSADPTACGTNYYVDGNINSDDLLNITYTGLTSSGSFMITLNQSVPKKVGELVVTMPSIGVYTLDLLNADEADINRGAEIRWGYGSTADPTDPTSPLRANTGGITGGQLRFYACAGDPDCIPEPGTLALLGLGGLAVGKRRRR